MTINIIDPHLHLFNRAEGNYDWLEATEPPVWPDKNKIQQNFSLTDLNLSNSDIKFNLAGFVHIEAGFDNEKPWREIAYIESLKHQSVRTIASVNLLDSPVEFKQNIDTLKQHQSLIGVRHIFDEQAGDILTNNNAQQNLACLNNLAKQEHFIFELQLPLVNFTPAATAKSTDESYLVMPLLLQTINNNRALKFVLNHAGFPAEQDNSAAMKNWHANIKSLAELPNVFIKCSGMEMINRKYDMNWFSQIVGFCIDNFSIDRVMIASNFPLCLLSNKNYLKYWQDIINSAIMQNSAKDTQNALVYSNALNIYQLPK